MNIGIVTTWFERGAAYVSKQYKQTLEKSFNVYIYARGGETQAKQNKNWDSKKITWAPPSPLPVPMGIDLEHFKKWLINNNIDLVFFNEQQWWPPILLCNSLKIKTGCYVDYYTEKTIPFFECYDFLICNTKRHYSVFNKHKQAFYIPWGTNTTLFSPKVTPPSNIVTFFHSSGYSPRRKGTDILLQAFHKLKGKKKLIIHTQKNLHKKLPTFSRLIDTLEKENQLVIITKTIPAPGLYHLGDAYIYPSRLDGIGLTLAEALSCGLPIVTNNNAPMNEFIKNNNGYATNIEKLYSRQDAYYWPQCDSNVNHLTKIMQNIINNKKNLHTLKRKARESALKYFDWEKNSKNLPTIFNTIKKQSCSKNIIDAIIKYEQLRGGIPRKQLIPKKFITLFKKLIFKDYQLH